MLYLGFVKINELRLLRKMLILEIAIYIKEV